MKDNLLQGGLAANTCLGKIYGMTLVVVVWRLIFQKRFTMCLLTVC